MEKGAVNATVLSSYQEAGCSFWDSFCGAVPPIHSKKGFWYLVTWYLSDMVSDVDSLSDEATGVIYVCFDVSTNERIVQ